MSNNSSIIIASDHAGYQLKAQLLQAFATLHPCLSFEDLGTNSEASCDYPDFASKLARLIQNGQYMRGILLCGSANGVAIVANKYSQVRAALAWIPEIAKLAREHNDANVICLPARYLNLQQALQIVHNFLHTDFIGGRHAIRVQKILELSDKNT